MESDNGEIYKRLAASLSEIGSRHHIFDYDMLHVKFSKYGLEKATDFERFWKAFFFGDPDIPGNIFFALKEALEINRDDAYRLVEELSNETLFELRKRYSDTQSEEERARLEKDYKTLDQFYNSFRGRVPELMIPPYSFEKPKMLRVSPIFPIETYEKDNIVFVLLPFKSPYKEHFEDIIKPLVESWRIGDNNLECIKADDISNPGQRIIEKIWKLILSARFIIADLTEINPNVMYELGLADAIGKKVIMMWNMSNGIRPPFDVNDREILFYETTTQRAIDKWKEDLNRAIDAILNNG